MVFVIYMTDVLLCPETVMGLLAWRRDGYFIDKASAPGNDELKDEGPLVHELKHEVPARAVEPVAVMRLTDRSHPGTSCRGVTSHSGGTSRC